jgi:thiamine-phosphate pyrophosphorylase
MVDTAGGHDPVDLSRILLDAGARILQLRLKDISSRELLSTSRAIVSLCIARGALMIVNDRVDVAMLAGAHGVHLGQEDLPPETARRVAPKNLIIGVSTHNVAQAVEAEIGGADYIGFGPIYPGGLKNNPTGKGLEKLRAVRAAIRIPVVAIGGITITTVPEVLAAGAAACAIITDVVRASDVAAKVRAILALKPQRKTA